MSKTETTAIPTPRARVQAMKEYHPPLGNRDALRLDFNENTVACSPKVREVLGRISAGELTRYPERTPIEAIVAEHLGLAAQQVALTNGVDEAIHVLFEAFLEAGDELLLPVPTYTMYEVYASATDAQSVKMQATDDLQFPFERLINAITLRTKIIAIANPQQPVGFCDYALRSELLRSHAARPAFCGAGGRSVLSFSLAESVVDLIGMLPNLVVARTFLKKRTDLPASPTRCARRPSGLDALGSSRAFAVQRELAGARVCASCA